MIWLNCRRWQFGLENTGSCHQKRLEGLEASSGLFESPSPSSSWEYEDPSPPQDVRTSQIVCGQVSFKMVNFKRLVPTFMCPEKVPVAILVSGSLFFYNYLLSDSLKGVYLSPQDKHLSYCTPQGVKTSRVPNKMAGFFFFFSFPLLLLHLWHIEVLA